MKIMMRLLITGLISVLSCGLQAATEKPLLMEGKKTLYQRVLSIPDARIYPAPDQSAASTEVTPFSVLYVYARQDDWIRVGYDSFGAMAGWMRDGQAIVWNQALTISFKDPQNIQRVMLFNTKKSLQDLVDGYDTDAYQHLYQSVV